MFGVGLSVYQCYRGGNLRGEDAKPLIALIFHASDKYLNDSHVVVMTVIYINRGDNQALK